MTARIGRIARGIELGGCHEQPRPAAAGWLAATGWAAAAASEHCRCVEHDGQRSVEAWTKARGEEVVCLALGGRGTGGAVVGQAQTQVERRDGDDQEQGHGADEHEQRPAGDGAGPAQPTWCPAPPGCQCPAARDASPEDASARETEQRRQQGDGHEDRDGDRHGGSDAHLGQDRDAHDRQAGERDDHGQAGEDDRGARRADGSPDRLEGVEVGIGLELPSEAGQDEQGVVDGDRETDHHGQDRGRGAQLDEAGGGGDEPHADTDAHERGQQWQASGDERPEGDEQHDGSDERCRWPRRRPARGPAGAHRHPTRRSACCAPRVGGDQQRLAVRLGEVEWRARCRSPGRTRPVAVGADCRRW